VKSFELENMVKGWFVGNFEPTVYRTSAVEIAVKHYKAGETEPVHHHKVATEITIIISGVVRMAGLEWCAGDIVMIEPDESTSFEAVTDTVNVVVKLPSVYADKYID